MRKNKTTTFILFTFLWIIYQSYRIGRLFYTPASHWDSVIYEGAMANFKGRFHHTPLICDHSSTCYPNHSLLIYAGTCEEAAGKTWHYEAPPPFDIYLISQSLHH